VKSASHEVPPMEVRRIRNRLNRRAILLVCGLCVLSFGWGVFSLISDGATALEWFLAPGPLALAYLLARQLPKYSDKTNV
jgi:hypothetical protein